MDAMKFDVLDMIREPDNYTSGERAQGSESVAKLLGSALGALMMLDHLQHCDGGSALDLIERDAPAIAAALRTALARFGGAE